MTVVPHPLYSPDLAPSDFVLFPRQKLKLGGKGFDDILEIQQKFKEALHQIMKQGFQKLFQQWQCRLTKCITLQEDYFEGDKMK
jgi:hypothetical protein